MVEKSLAAILLVSCACFLQAAWTRKAVQLSLRINERGTKFTEKIEINDDNTAIFRVPAHNDVERSDVMIDYKQKLSATRIPRLKECHVEEIFEDFVRSPVKLFNDISKLKFVYDGKPEAVRTIHKTVVKMGEFKPPSRSIAKFCGKYRIFKMAIVDVGNQFDSTGEDHRIQKRSAKRDKYLRALKKHFYPSKEDRPPADDEDTKDDDDGSGSGSGWVPQYVPNIKAAQTDVQVLCRSLGDYDLDGCIDMPPEQWKRKLVKSSHTCMYQVRCQKPWPNPKGGMYPGKCYEFHSSTSQVCYDVFCDKSTAV